MVKYSYRALHSVKQFHNLQVLEDKWWSIELDDLLKMSNNYDRVGPDLQFLFPFGGSFHHTVLQDLTIFLRAPSHSPRFPTLLMLQLVPVSSLFSKLRIEKSSTEVQTGMYFKCCREAHYPIEECPFLHHHWTVAFSSNMQCPVPQETQVSPEACHQDIAQ